MNGSRAKWAAMGLILSVYACGSGDSGSPEAATALASRADLETALAEVAGGGDVERFWERVVAAGRMPFVFGRTAIFLYRGEAERVDWVGDHSQWEQSWLASGERVGETDLWRKTLQLLPESRLDYKIVVDGEWQLDPLNPVQQVGGYGPNSVVATPDWRPSEWVEPRQGQARGVFTEELSFASQRLGYPVIYRVYTPPGLDESAAGLPTLFVTDGSDYWREEMGALVLTLDNLHAAGRLRPAVVVFVDHWDRKADFNRRQQELVPAPDGSCEFCEFLVDELMPEIDRRYPTDRAPGARGILGTSLGGLHATFMGLEYRELFGVVGIQSPAYWPAEWVLDRLDEATGYPPRVFFNVGRYELSYQWNAKRVRGRMEELGSEVLGMDVADGHSWGHWRNTLGEALLFFYGEPDS